MSRSRRPSIARAVAIDDLIDFTPELRAEAVKIVSRYKLGPIFTPPVVSKWDGPLGTLMLPSATGGANWQGGSLDPETNFLYIFRRTPIVRRSVWSRRMPTAVRHALRARDGVAIPTAPPPAVPAAGGGGGEGGGGLTVQGLPLVKPPYATITALDLNKGEMVWQIAHGETPDNIRNHPALKGLTFRAPDAPGRIGMLATKTLVIAGEGGFFTTPNGQRGAMLRAYDKATGRKSARCTCPRRRPARR